MYLSKYNDKKTNAPYYYGYIDENTIVKIMQDAIDPWENEKSEIIEIIEIIEIKHDKTIIEIRCSEKIFYKE